MKLLRSLLGLAGLFIALTAIADTATESAFRASLLRSFDDASGKIMQLAEAIPESAYGWQPMEGVNTVREVLVHVTTANLALGSMLGGKLPAGLNPQTVGEAMKTKAEAMAVAKQGMEFARGVLAGIPTEELAVEIKFYGGPASKARVSAVVADHAHEHLGQLIAYARSNHVTPPWSK